MAVFLATLSPLLMLFLCIAIGFTLKKTNVLPDGAGRVIAKLETWVFVPALNFMTMVRFCTPATLTTHATNVVLGSFSVLIAMAMALVLCRFLVQKKCAERNVYCYALTFANSGYLGDPIVLALFGEGILSYYKLFCLPINLIIYTWGVGLLTPVKEGDSPFKRLLNAPTIATILGIVCGLAGVESYMPSFLTSTLDGLKACMGPCGMLLAGVTIARYDFLGMLKKKKVYLATALRLLVLPAILVAALFGIKALANLLLGASIGNDVLFLCLFATAAPWD
ncbi:MAG: AEC family transporter [Clostridia bacterium]|nr:AEC family transporter [Clostridia bacterium]